LTRSSITPLVVNKISISIIRPNSAGIGHRHIYY